MAEPKGGLGYIGDSPEALESAESALEKLSRAYEARSKQFFDPQMLALAEGFLAPTRSGGFGESLGNAANRMRLAQEAQGKQEIENAQGNMAIIQQKAALEQQKRLGKEYAGLREEMGLVPSKAPAGQAPAEGQPPAGQPPAGQPPAAGQPPNPMASMFNMEFDFSKPMPVDKAAILAKNEAAGIRGAVSKLDIQKAERDNIIYKEGFVHDQNTGKLKLIPKYGEEDVQTYVAPFGDFPGGNLKVPKSTKAALDYAAQIGSPAYWDLAKLAVNGPPRAPAPGQAPAQEVQRAPAGPTAFAGEPSPTQVGAVPTAAPMKVEPLPPLEGIKGAIAPPAPQPAPPAVAPPPPAAAPRRRTMEEEKTAEEKRAMELRLEEERRKGEQKAKQERGEIRPAALEKQATEQEIKARDEIETNRKEADSTILFANQFRKFAELPNSEKMFGILNNDKISSGIATLVKDAMRVGDTSVGIPAIETVMRNANLSTKEQAQYRSFLQLTTQLQLQQAKYMKGPVSNYERTIVADAVIGPQDTPETIVMKADIMAARAQFDRQVAKRFKDSKQDAAQFLSGDDYREMLDKYNTRLFNIVGGKVKLQPKDRESVGKPTSTVSRADALAGIR
jgi:hypothetical protein